MNIIFLVAFSFMIALLGSSPVVAQPTNTASIYMIKEKESLDSVAQKFLPTYRVKYGKRVEEFKKDLMEWNPQITNWSEIPMFSNIYIEYPYPVYISNKYSDKLSPNTNYNILNSDSETPLGNNRFTFFAMYTTSSGTFQEQFTTQDGSISSTQNSPISLGLGTTFFLDKTNRMISASGYWSSLRASKLSGDVNSSKELETSPEFGFNLYYQQLTPWSGLSLYGGMDYENFSTFNTADYLSGTDLAFNKNKIFFATFGAARTFFWDDLKILVKSSLSQSIKSDTTSENSEDSFKGQRFLLFTSLKGESRFTYHLIYKRHMLTGPTKLTVNRIGLGIGFVIF